MCISEPSLVKSQKYTEYSPYFTEVKRKGCRAARRDPSEVMTVFAGKCGHEDELRHPGACRNDEQVSREKSGRNAAREHA